MDRKEVGCRVVDRKEDGVRGAKLEGVAGRGGRDEEV